MLPPWRRPEIIAYSIHIAASFRHWTGKDLIASHAPEVLAEKLYHAPFVVLSHGTEPDPLFRYANLAAQKLWKLPWEQFIGMPSRLSAEPDAQDERKRLLARAKTQGYIDDYQGIRVTSDGKRFKIKNCILWNVLNETGDKIGQAATFGVWDLV